MMRDTPIPAASASIALAAMLVLAAAAAAHPTPSEHGSPGSPGVPAPGSPATTPREGSTAAPDAAQTDDMIVVSTRGDGRALLIDPTDGAIVAAIEAKIGLHEIACSPDGRLAVGSAYGEGPRHQTPDRRLCVIDVTRREVVRTIDLRTEAGVEHPRPNDLLFHPDGRRVLVTSEARNALLEVDVAEGRIVREIRHGLRAGHMLAVTPDWRRAFVPGVLDGTVAAIDLDKGEVLTTIPTAAGAEGVACSPDGKSVWVANNRADSITVIDATELKPVITFPSTGFPFRVRFTPDGRNVLVSCPQANLVRIYDAATHAARGEIAVDGAPTSIAVDRTGARACVVSAASGRVSMLNLVTHAVERTVDAGPEADGLAWAFRSEASAPGAPTARSMSPAGQPATTVHPCRTTIVPSGEPGEPLEVTGVVFAPDGATPLPGVTVYVYQTDRAGTYGSSRDRPRLRGWMTTDAGGRYGFRTIRPAPYPGQAFAAHIHVQLWGGGWPAQYAEDILFADDPLLTAGERTRSGQLGRFAPIRTPTRSDEGILRVVHDLRVRPTGDTFEENTLHGVRDEPKGGAAARTADPAGT